MSKDIWGNEDEDGEFRDMPDETNLDQSGRPVQAPPVNLSAQRLATPSQPKYRNGNIPVEPTVTNPAYDYNKRPITIPNLPEIDLEDDFTEVLNDANLRIEQGRLYQMIMNHDLFEGMDADPRAIQNVQREIRKFARESMEVMLGMRETVPIHANIASPFNDLEVEILKKIASKASSGATESPEANKIASSFKEPRKTLMPIGGSTGLKKSIQPKMERQSQSLPSKAQVPIPRTKMNATVEQILSEEGVSREEIEEDYKPLGKPVTSMTPQELEKRAKETAARLASRKTVKSPSALPMATPEQQEMLAAARAGQITAAPGMAALLEKVKSMPIKNLDYV